MWSYSWRELHTVLLMSLTLASRSWWDPSPVGQRKEVATVETRLEPAPPEASSSQKGATRPELGRKGFYGRWSEQPHLSGLGTLLSAFTMVLQTFDAVLIPWSRIIYALLCLPS